MLLDEATKLLRARMLKKNYVAENDIWSGLGLKNDKVSETESDSSMTKGNKKESRIFLESFKRSKNATFYY